MLSEINKWVAVLLLKYTIVCSRRRDSGHKQTGCYIAAFLLLLLSQIVVPGMTVTVALA